MKFAIFYEDGSIVEGGDDSDEEVTITLKTSKKWLEAPTDGVLAVVQENPYTCRYVWRDDDYYYTLPDSGEMCSTSDLGAFLRGHFKGFVKFGLCTDDKTFQEVMKNVYWYDRIPRKCQRIENPAKKV